MRPSAGISAPALHADCPGRRVYPAAHGASWGSGRLVAPGWHVGRCVLHRSSEWKSRPGERRSAG